MQFIFIFLAIALGVYVGRNPREAWEFFKSALGWIILACILLLLLIGVMWIFESGAIYDILSVIGGVVGLVITYIIGKELYIDYFSKNPEHIKAREEKRKEKEKIKKEAEKAKKEKLEKMTDEEKEEYYRMKKKYKKDWIIIIICMSIVFAPGIIMWILSLFWIMQ